MNTKVIANERNVDISAEQCELLFAWLREEDPELYETWMELEKSFRSLESRQDVPVKLTIFLMAHLSVNDSVSAVRAFGQLRKHYYETHKEH